MRRLKYMLATATIIVVTVALATMTILQILDIKQLTLKQVGVAVLAMAACTAVIGGEYKK